MDHRNNISIIRSQVLSPGRLQIATVTIASVLLYVETCIYFAFSSFSQHIAISVALLLNHRHEHIVDLMFALHLRSIDWPDFRKRHPAQPSDTAIT